MEPFEEVLKRVLGFVPGEDDELWEKMERDAAERIAREGGIGWDMQRAAETDWPAEQKMLDQGQNGRTPRLEIESGES
ncbi:hypothetical protein [Nocardiopsis alkaliphila]|uniref:hypothetical protein n=1 Tax=Nocardiopsis alkaliphila TaxID=225762 RepID=UPI0003489CCA|nr:hypothetical protein [Nocardiopsis alkaliphila]